MVSTARRRLDRRLPNLFVELCNPPVHWRCCASFAIELVGFGECFEALAELSTSHTSH